MPNYAQMDFVALTLYQLLCRRQYVVYVRSIIRIITFIALVLYCNSVTVHYNGWK